ncbi:lysosomal-trafficking regulator isoform X2 [Toxorhynchites rutilus septentrionalis]|uniref:lysosomal-trafficking regulator isoform X2 n=1 Tax=Toxorhynchites rutilus septentrionalis TaxID=329112 RepID=UPI00247A1EEE|nr:lysosomal-trafficking regulator isoform X2 [Toxorhynchites rutilus septentrionalis]
MTSPVRGSGTPPQQMSPAGIDTLWLNFLNVSSGEDENSSDDVCNDQNGTFYAAGANKIAQLETFLQAFGTLSEDQRIQFQRSVISESISSTLSRYLLLFIYKICNSPKSVASVSGDALDEKSCKGSQSISAAWNSTADDTTQVNSLSSNEKESINGTDYGENRCQDLREFLLEGVGGRILQSLEHIGTEDIVNDREFATVLIRILPTKKWRDSYQAELPYCPAYNSRLLQLFGMRTCNSEWRNGKKQVIKSLSPTESSNAEKQTEQMQLAHSRVTSTQDQLTLTILNLLESLVMNENVSTIDEKSVTVSCLRMAIDRLRQQVLFEECPRNRSIIRHKLLGILMLSLNNLFFLDKIETDHISLKQVSSQVMEILRIELELNSSDPISCDFIFNLTYTIVSSVNQSFLQFCENLVSEQYFYPTFRLLESNLEIIKHVYGLLHASNSNTHGKIIDILLTMHRNFVETLAPNRTNGRRMSKGRHRLHHARQDPRTMYVCALERILLNVFPVVKLSDQRTLLKFFSENQICCCNATIGTLEVLLRRTNFDLVQRICLNFANRSVIRAIFDQSDCDTCKQEHSNKKFVERFTAVHCDLFDAYARVEDRPRMPIFLKYLLDVANVISPELAEVVLFELVLPQLRKELDRFGDDGAVEDITKEIVNGCLQIVARCLKGASLFEALFTEENLTMFVKLSRLAEFIYQVGVILKLGIEHQQPQFDEVSDKLGRILIHNLRGLSQYFEQLFRTLKSSDVQINLKVGFTKNTEGMVWNGTTADMLQICVEHWKLIRYLLQVNKRFHDTFVNHFDDAESFLLLIHNLFSLLMHHGGKRSPPPLSELTDLDESASPERRSILNIFHFNDQLLENHPLPSGDMFYGNDSTSSSHQEEKDFSFLREKSVLKLPTASQETLDNGRMEKHWSLMEMFNIKSFVVELVDEYITGTKSPTRQEDLPEQVKQLLSTRGFIRKRIAILVELMLSAFQLLAYENNQLEDAMQSALIELKKLLLSGAFEDWDSPETTKNVMNALQSLLKIAEVRCESAAGVENVDVLGDDNGYFFPVHPFGRKKSASAEDDISSTDESYTTAFDDGYEGDCEYDPLLPSVVTRKNSFRSKRPGCVKIDQNICTIVVDILMELSKECAKNPKNWCPVLAQMVLKLGGIRDHLGGSLHLITGFGPILAKSDLLLKELQTSVLELITDLESPKVFTKFLQLLSLEDPPVRLILSKLMNIVDTKFKLECYTEIEFPNLNDDGTLVSTCDVMLSKKINYLREHHRYYNIRSPFTCSAKMIPLNYVNFSPWNKEGSTASAWFRLNLNQQDSNRLSLTHLISVGSEKQIVSVFLNRQRQFTVRFNKPDLIISSANTKLYLENALGLSCCDDCAKELSHLWTYKSTIRPIQPTAQAFRIDTPGAQCVYCYKQLRVGRKVAITSKPPNDYFYDLNSGQYLVKDLQLTDDRWHMLVLSVQQLDDYVSVVLTLDGVQQQTLTITDPCKIHIDTALPVLAIGHRIGVEDDYPVKFSLSNVQLFGKCITDNSILVNLYAIGPNWIDLTGFSNGESIPNYGSIDLSKLTLEDLQPGNAFEQLKRFLIGYYTALKPEQFFLSKPGAGKISLGMMSFSPCVFPKDNPSLQRSILLSGGITVLLFAFARVVELTESSRVHADALNLLLRVAHDNHDFYNEFLQRDLLELVGIVLKNKKCRKEICVLAALLEVTFDQLVLTRRNDAYSVRSNSMARVRYPEIIIFFFENFHIWNDRSEEVLNLVFEVLTVVTREKHPGNAYNSKRLATAGLVPTLIDFCRMNFVIPSKTIKISKFAADSLVALVSSLSSSPPSVNLLREIIELLLLMHKPTDSYVTHDRQKFYFNINAQIPSRSPKSNDTNIAQRLNFRERRLKLRKVIPLALSTSTTNSSFDSTASCIELAKLGGRKSESSDSTTDTPRGGPAADYEANYARLNEALSDLSVRKRHLKTGRHKVRRLRTQSTRACQISKERIPMSKSCVRRDTQRSTQSLPVKFKFFEQNYFGTGNDFIQESFLRAMCDFLLILPDSEAKEFFDSDNKIIETILILANNSNIRIRTAIINLTAVISDRVSSGSSAQLNYTDEQLKIFWHHLGNQIGSHSVNVDLLNCCLRWVTKSSAALGLESLVSDYQFDVVQESGLNVLQAILPQSCVDPRLFQVVLNLIDNICTKQPKAAHYMVDNGLIWTVVKTAIKMHEKGDCEQTSNPDSFLEFITNFSHRALASTIFVNSFWDLINGLTLAEKHKNPKVTNGIRDIHALLFQNLLRFFIYHPTESIIGHRNNSFTVDLPECTIPKTEVKIRYNQIHDKAVQLITSCGADHKISDAEILLIKSLMKRTLNGNPRGGNIILWCLLPKRPIGLKLYTIKQLGQYLDGGNYLSLICDVRMLKVFTQSILLMNKKDMSSEDFGFATAFCQAIEGSQNSTWTLTQTLEEFDYLRMVNLNDQEQIILKSISKQEKRIYTCTVTAMDITRKIVENQNKLRKELIILLKKDSDFKFFNQWRQIIDQMTHEDAPWYNPNLYPSSWELDDTYGSDLAQKRMRRCHMTVNRRFLQREICPSEGRGNREQLLAYLMPKNRSQEFSMENQVLYTSSVKQISPKHELDSECILTSTELVLSPSTGELDIYDLDSISKIWTKRFQHQETAVEIFFKTSKSLFLVFDRQVEREIFAGFFQDLVQREGRQELETQTQLWRDGALSNWEYLMHLNQISGRTYHDLMQYPVFPWILADYEGRELDLLAEKSFRNLEKPIAVQHSELETHYINNYNYLKQAEYESISNVRIQPYHYSSHYSNSGTVLHFLVRMLPFTSLFLHYQDNSFDIPDRTFHSLFTTWNLASRDSPTDVKELIPEFFCLPEFLENLECFDFGVRQSGEPVNHVELPVWCHQSARMFVLIHRQALESDYVRKRLSHWIDLIFGYKQTGPAAVEAINVFHPATYATFSASNIEDPVEKLALETMIKTYGQMPRQLFDTPHPQASINPLGVNGPEVVENVVGLKWGLYSGTPVLPSPKIVDMRTSPKNLASLVQTDSNKIVGLPPRTSIFRGLPSKGHFVVDWGQLDGVIRVRSIQDNDTKSNELVYNTNIDPITACGCDPSCPDIWFGHRSGRIVVFQQRQVRKASFFNQNIQSTVTRTRSSSFRRWIDRKSATLRKKLEGDDIGEHSFGSLGVAPIKWSFPVALMKHQAEITAIAMCPEFKIVVSVSMDGIATIWDSNSLSYVREIPKPVNVIHSKISLVCISPTLGDIVTIHSSQESKSFLNRSDESSILVDDDSFEVTENYNVDYVNIMMGSSRDQLRLHTVNAKYVEHVFLESAVMSMCYTSVKEGCGVNCIAVGLDTGTIRLYSSWNLALVREITMNPYDECGIRCLLYSKNQHLIVLTTSNVIQTWKSEGLPGTSPQTLELPVRRSIS